MEEVLTGEELVRKFFSEISEIKGVDKEIVELLIRLFTEGKLSQANIANQLDQIRRSALND